MGALDEFLETYDVKPDPRSERYFLMGTVYWPVGLSVLYLYLVLIAVPKFMKNRPAYDLKTFIKCYNIYQIVACTYTGWGVLTSGWTTKFTLGCEPIEYSNDPEALRLLYFMYLVSLVKLTEYSETIVFVLRKKDRQVSFLHMYHHVSTFFITWIGARYVGGGMASFPILPNSLVHIVMYTYYLLSSSNNSTVQKILRKIKPYITIMQMVQFVIILIHASQAYNPRCKVPPFLVNVFIPDVLLIFYLFYDFYRSTFNKSKQKEQNGKLAKAS